MAKKKTDHASIESGYRDGIAMMIDSPSADLGSEVEVTPGSVDPSQSTAADHFLRDAMAKDAARGHNGPPRRQAGPKPRINPNAVDARPVYGVFLDNGSTSAHTLVCLCDTIGRARKQCETLQQFPAYAGKPLVIQRIKAVEKFRP